MEDTEFCIHNEAEYIEAVSRLDSLFDQLYGSKKKEFRDLDEKTFYLACIMNKVEMLQDAITDYEVSLMQAKDSEL